MYWEHLERGSSPVDWCEENYLYSPNIAEFFNTFSNILFFLLPPILIHLFKEYARFVNPGIHIVWILFFVVGLSSAYFHATLSLIGQLLDEVAIIWVFMAAFTIFYPSKFLPKQMMHNRKLFVLIMCMLTVTASALSFWHPAINAFVLMFLAIPAIYLLFHELKNEKLIHVRHLGIWTLIVWFMAVSIWVSDRLQCNLWSSLRMPYLHAIWHILIFITSNSTVALSAYYHVKLDYNNLRPAIKYWPDNFQWGVPYVSIKCHYKDFEDEC